MIAATFGANQALPGPGRPSGQPRRKRCSRCRRQRAISVFAPRCNRRAGVQPYCRACGQQIGRVANARYKYRYACRAAAANGHPLQVDEPTYLALVAQPCHYCGGPLAATGVGLDRLDNSLGYAQGNVVPCCALCNVVRADRFTPNEMALYLGPAIRACLGARAAAGTPLRIGRWSTGRRRG